MKDKKDWYQANKLSLNVNKTVLLKFWPDEQGFSVHVGGTPISDTPFTKFLGVTVDDRLTWKEYTNNLYCKIFANTRLLMNAKKLLPESCLLKIYYAHVYSLLIYGISVWGMMCPKSSQNSIDYKRNV